MGMNILLPTVKKKSTKEGKKNRKYGRGLRKPCHQRYVSESRWIKNKINRILRFVKNNHKYKCIANIDNNLYRFFYSKKEQKAIYKPI